MQRNNEYNLFDWKPIAGDTVMGIMNLHCNEGIEVPIVKQVEIRAGRFLHHYQFENSDNDLVVVFRDRGARFFRRITSDPVPPQDGTSAQR